MTYERVNWQNTPSVDTPINAENLNKMDKGIDDASSQLAEKVNTTDIIQTDTVNDVTKIPSSAVTYGLGQEIDTLNNNLAWGAPASLTLQNGATGTVQYTKNGTKLCAIYGTITLSGTSYVNQTLLLSTVLPVGYRPVAHTPILCYGMGGSFVSKIRPCLVINKDNGQLSVATETSLVSGDVVTFSIVFRVA